jgi:hypothetical protein
MAFVCVSAHCFATLLAFLYGGRVGVAVASIMARFESGYESGVDEGVARAAKWR